MTQSMGIGILGQPKTIIKRKFRFLMEFTTPYGAVLEPRFVKVANRPQLDIDEQEIHFLNDIQYIPGKGRWQPMSVTYYDVAHEDMRPLYEWVLDIYNFNEGYESGNLSQSEKEGWAGTGILTVLDGCGRDIERWSFKDVWPNSINFGDLDYSVSDECNIELTFRFSKAKLEGVSCMPTGLTGVCTGCT